MVEISFDTKNLDKSIVEELEDFMVRVAADLSNFMADEAPVGATGNLRNSIQILGYNSSDGSIVVASKAEYSLDVIQGQEPGTWPDYSSMSKWVRRVIGASEYQSWGGDDWEVNTLEEATYIMQRHVYQQGTQPNDFVGRSIQRLKQKYS